MYFLSLAWILSIGMLVYQKGTLPETNTSPLKIGRAPKRKGFYSNHPFSGATVDGRNPAPPGMLNKTL